MLQNLLFQVLFKVGYEIQRCEKFALRNWSSIRAFL